MDYCINEEDERRRRRKTFKRENSIWNKRKISLFQNSPGIFLNCHIHTYLASASSTKRKESASTFSSPVEPGGGCASPAEGTVAEEFTLRWLDRRLATRVSWLLSSLVHVAMSVGQRLPGQMGVYERSYVCYIFIYGLDWERWRCERKTKEKNKIKRRIRQQSEKNNKTTNADVHIRGSHQLLPKNLFYANHTLGRYYNFFRELRQRHMHSKDTRGCIPELYFFLSLSLHCLTFCLCKPRVQRTPGSSIVLWNITSNVTEPWTKDDADNESQ